MRTNAAKQSVLALAVIVLSSTSVAQKLSGDPSLVPMYGGMDRQSDPVLKGADDALIEGTTKEFGSRNSASRRFTDAGFRYYFRNDLGTAMRRFNQGWLLDPNNPDVFYGFMAVLNDRDMHCDARQMAEKAFELGLEKSAETLADAGREYALCAMQDTTLDDSTKTAYTKRSSEYFTEALILKPNSPYVYGHWASAAYRLGNYPAAWDYVALQRKYGGKPAKQFLKLLRAKMPEPRR